MLEGILVPHVTPFREDESVNDEALGELVEYFIFSGVSGLVTLGSNGEFPYLSREERLHVIKTVLESVNGRVPVIAGTAYPSTKETVEFSWEAWDLGVDALLIAPPFYFKPSPREIYHHYSRIAESVDAPIVLYNVPKFTGYNIPLDVIQALAEEHSNIIAIKDSSGEVSRIAELVRRLGDEVSVLAGTGDMIFPALSLGAQGAVVAIANVAPRMCVELYRAFTENQLERARKLQLKLNLLNEVLVKSHNQLSAIKEAMRLLGLEVGYPRSPTLPLSEEEFLEVERVLTFSFNKPRPF